MKKSGATFLTRSPVRHGQLRVVLVRLSSPRRLLVQGAEGVVGGAVAAANQLVLATCAHVLTLKSRKR